MEIKMRAKLGIAPIAWWNDDLAELSDDVSLEECLRQAREAALAPRRRGLSMSRARRRAAKTLGFPRRAAPRSPDETVAGPGS